MSLFDRHPLSYPVRTMRAYCVRVVDADTYHIEADCGFHASMTIPVRLRGVNAPELLTEAGRRARAAVQALIEGKPIVLTPYRDRQSFARWIGDVQFYVPPPDYGPESEEPGAWADLADWLVTEGLAVRV